LTSCSRGRACSRSRRTLGSGSQIADTSSRWESAQAPGRRCGRSCRPRAPARLSFCASAISSSQPSCSRPSCTNRAPSSTRSPRPPAPMAADPARRAAQPSASVAATSASTSSPFPRPGRRQGACDSDPIQRATWRRGPLEHAPRWTRGACYRGGPPSRQSVAQAGLRPRLGTTAWRSAADRPVPAMSVRPRNRSSRTTALKVCAHKRPQ
jgi:hypothetical protein